MKAPLAQSQRGPVPQGLLLGVSTGLPQCLHKAKKETKGTPAGGAETGSLVDPATSAATDGDGEDDTTMDEVPDWGSAEPEEGCKSRKSKSRTRNRKGKKKMDTKEEPVPEEEHEGPKDPKGGPGGGPGDGPGGSSGGGGDGAAPAVASTA